jgi:hypothetical protein
MRFRRLPGPASMTTRRGRASTEDWIQSGVAGAAEILCNAHWLSKHVFYYEFGDMLSDLPSDDSWLRETCSLKN